MTRRTPTRLAGALAGVAALLAAGTSPVAAAPEEREPAWTSPFEVSDPDDNDVVMGESVVDPTSGDFLTLVTNDEHPVPHRVRRVDGATGATEWEVGLDSPGSGWDLQLAIDPDGARVVAADEAAGAALHSVGLDGTVQWSRSLKAPGDVADLVVDPATGTACVLTGSKAAPKRGKAGAWRLTCTDRSGATTANRKVQRHALDGAPTGLAVDAGRDRWYVSGTTSTARGSRTVVLALDAAGKRAWRRTLAHPQDGATAGALVVDPRTHRVLLGGSSTVATKGGRHPARDRAHLVAWSAKGKQALRRTWSSGPGGSTVTDLAVSSAQDRVVAATERRNGKVAFRLMDAEGKLLREVAQPGRDVATRVAIDPERGLVVFAGKRLAVHDLDGRPAWRSADDDYFVHDLDHDPVRGRVVVSWTPESGPGSPDAWVSAWGL
jgi:hypothetical protein